MNFSELGLEESILKAVTDLGFEEPTVIQQKAIPTLLSEDRDLVGLAQTGTGKTAAFGLPLLHKVDPKLKKVQGLILSPTRELCVQIASDLTNYAKYKRVANVAIYGGASITTQISAIKRGAQVIVATPGRLNDLIKRKAVDLSQVQIAILDEADEMLNMGFKDELDFILSQTPDSKNTWLFSATMPKEVRRIASEYMNDPAEVSSGQKNSTNENIEHQYVMVNHKVRYEALKRILDFNPEIFAVIFCRTKRDTQEVADKLGQDGYNSDALHGDLSQAQRDRVMKKFRDKGLSILVATDVAARGIDVNGITHVIHHQLPEEIENYTHRSGRTARAGKKGVSVALVGGKDKYKIRQLEKMTGAQFTELTPPSAEEICERKLVTFGETLNAIVIDEKVEKYAGKMIEIFADLSKEDLIKKMATEQMKQLLDYYGNNENLDVSAPQGRARNSNADRFFINLGSLDELTQDQLKEVLGSHLGLDASQVLSCDIKDSFSFFEYTKGAVAEVLATSGKVEYNGRDIRIEQSIDKPRSGGGDRRGGGGGRRFSNDGGGRSRSYGGGGNRGDRRSGGGDRSRSGSRDGGGFRGRSGGGDRDRSGGGDRSRSGGGDRDRSGGGSREGGRGRSDRGNDRGGDRPTGRREGSSPRNSAGGSADGSKKSNFGSLDSSLTY